MKELKIVAYAILALAASASAIFWPFASVALGLVGSLSFTSFLVGEVIFVYLAIRWWKAVLRLIRNKPRKGMAF